MRIWLAEKFVVVLLLSRSHSAVLNLDQNTEIYHEHVISLETEGLLGDRNQMYFK